MPKITDAPNGENTSPVGTESLSLTGSKYSTLNTIKTWLTSFFVGKTGNETVAGNKTFTGFNTFNPSSDSDTGSIIYGQSDDKDNYGFDIEHFMVNTNLTNPSVYAYRDTSGIANITGPMFKGEQLDNTSDSGTVTGDFVNLVNNTGLAFSINKDGKVNIALGQTYDINGTPHTHTISQSFVGYNTAGGSTENMTSRKVYAKKVTLANDGLITNISIYVDAGVTTDQVRDLSVAMYSDNSGTPQYIIAANNNPNLSLLLDTTAGAGGNSNPRWLSIPLCTWLTAGDYWIAVASFAANAAATLRIYYDGSGTDRTYPSGGDWFADWGFYTPTTTSNKYSIRANFIR